MEVAVPAPPVDFNFDSACSSPYMTAPSSPQRFGNFFFSSAPTSPTRAAAFYYDFNDFANSGRNSSASEIPFLWEEEEPRKILKSRGGGDSAGDDDGSCIADEDFEFDFSGQLERISLSADELFDCGKIKPLKPLPCHRFNDSISNKDVEIDQKRGRERTTSSNSLRSSSTFRRIGSRSLSPLRVSDIMLDLTDQENPQKPSDSSNSTDQKHSASPSSSSFLSAFSFSKGNRRWKIRDFLLFRSASEGRATDKKSRVEEMKNSSFRSVGSLKSESSYRRRRPISAHELHYKTNRAVSEELKRKTTLPYKHGLLGCLGFNSRMHTTISTGIGSLTRG